MACISQTGKQCCALYKVIISLTEKTTNYLYAANAVGLWKKDPTFGNLTVNNKFLLQYNLLINNKGLCSEKNNILCFP